MVKKILKYIFVVVIAIGLTGTIIINVFGNFYKVNDGVFRSGQLNKYNLEYYTQKHNIKTIINLRGKDTDRDYIDEIKISKKYEIEHIDYEMSNKKYLDFNKTLKIVKMLENVKKPVLIHCLGGADRTSLVAGLYQIAIAKTSLETAKKQFSILYGHAPFIRKHVLTMDESFDNYVKKMNEVR